LDRRLRTVEDLEEAYGLPVLGRIPRNRQLAKASERTSLRALDEGADEAFRLLRANLRYYNVDREIRSILVASPESGDGKTTIARMLAMTMASMGDEVVLVETDLHKKATGALADSSLTGLSTVLAGYTELDDALLPPQEGWDRSREDGEPFTVLPKGPLPPNPSELVDSDRMRSLLKTLEGRFDVVILDTPPLIIISDALSLVPLVSGILVVSSLGRTSREIAQGFRKQLGLLRARPLGLVVNFTVPEENYYYSRSTASAAV
jgi:capsular exopolysaccharide synthesis family protein